MSIAKTLVVVGLATLWAGSAMAQSAREKAVTACVAQAQKQVPAAGDDSGNQDKQRFSVYAACMKKMGQRA